MIKHAWSVLSQSASIDIETNSVSLFNIIETIVVSGEPSVEKPAILFGELVSFFCREDIDKPIKGMMRATLVDPNGTVRPAQPIEVDLVTSPFHRTRIRIDGLTIATLGMHHFIIETDISNDVNGDWMQVASIPFQIMKQKDKQNSVEAIPNKE